ncbi:uncharacterized protein LACBIDRAFT_328041 [Laccaria bicolor S238N-H82]|uniref:Predicted protein n=1 Tax=Laccaria bicolor (strain S238N-H82 / ATCC MYA-4686) TaxID=486041 RepID=B0DDJ9_LACBS|nr:uncharacterized protein LACBIDRAFT_328041 [Laccaria bicolor S238N-H82]EDR07099.1 predicted protein [Laccaria bicolor S238N-H82]|eukprot:XP_001882030.1 predicted protein [Laccaria bicolor S238N-H82]
MACSIEKYEEEEVEIIPMPSEDSILTIAFALKEVLDKYSEHILEVTMDSTWKTNTLGYEQFVIITEANGQALPLAFAFTASTDGTAMPGAKELMLVALLGHVVKQCPNINFTLMDKDTDEISAV